MSTVLRVALFGASERGRQCVSDVAALPGVELVRFLDNAPAKWGTTWLGLPVLRPTAEHCADVDVIVIATVHVGEVFAQLRRLGVGRQVALSPADLARRFLGRRPDAAPVPATADLGLASRGAHALADLLGARSQPVDVTNATAAACTICCNNYLAYATVLADSYLRHHPDHRFFICLADRRAAGLAYPTDPRIRVIEAAELGIEGFEQLAFRYATIEFTTSLKPFLLQVLLATYALEALLYLDPDILVCAPLESLFAPLRTTSLALVPHILSPLEDDRSPSEIDIMRAGTFNLGIIGVARSDETTRFLGWWARRLRWHCTTEVEKGLFTDQKWIDLVPSLFPGYAIVRDPGVDVAYWNLHERTVAVGAGTVTVNEVPLRAFHFSGIDIADLDAVSRHQNRHRLPQAGPLRDLFEAYRLLLVRAGHVEVASCVPGYTHFDDGTPIPTLARHIYREAGVAEQFPHPFDSEGTGSFLAWLQSPARPGGELSQLFAGIHRLSPDLRRSFPDAAGQDELALVAYIVAAADLYGLAPCFLDAACGGSASVGG